MSLQNRTFGIPKQNDFIIYHYKKETWYIESIRQ